MIAVAFAATAAVGGAADSVMRRQADGFLQALPDGLQQTQTLAVEKAIAGDNAALMAVRNSRNTRQALSENVSVRQLSESLRLYEPSGVDGRLRSRADCTTAAMRWHTPATMPLCWA